VPRDQRLVDQHQVELARDLAGACREYVEQQLGLRALSPPPRPLLLRRLQELYRLQGELEQTLRALLDPPG
jgi:hypothetical protein